MTNKENKLVGIPSLIAAPLFLVSCMMFAIAIVHNQLVFSGAFFVVACASLILICVESILFNSLFGIFDVDSGAL